MDLKWICFRLKKRKWICFFFRYRRKKVNMFWFGSNWHRSTGGKTEVRVVKFYLVPQILSCLHLFQFFITHSYNKMLGAEVAAATFSPLSLWLLAPPTHSTRTTLLLPKTITNSTPRPLHFSFHKSCRTTRHAHFVAQALSSSSGEILNFFFAFSLISTFYIQFHALVYFL